MILGLCIWHSFVSFGNIDPLGGLVITKSFFANCRATGPAVFCAAPIFVEPFFGRMDDLAYPFAGGWLGWLYWHFQL